MVKVISTEPHKSVVKEIVCKNCGATLQYVPKDIQGEKHYDYLGDCDDYYVYIPKVEDVINYFSGNH
jgi:hypothetical protein